MRNQKPRSTFQCWKLYLGFTRTHPGLIWFVHVFSPSVAKLTQNPAGQGSIQISCPLPNFQPSANSFVFLVFYRKEKQIGAFLFAGLLDQAVASIFYRLAT